MTGSSRDRPIVVIGSRPGLRLPDVDATEVIAANAAVPLTQHYRSHFGSSLTAVIASTGLRDDAWLKSALRAVAPDEIVVPGSKVANASAILTDELGLEGATIRIFDRDWGFKLLRERIGRRAYWAASRRYRFYTPEVKRLVRYVYRILARKQMRSEMASTGVTAILLALTRSDPDGIVVVTGIGLTKGGHFNGLGTFGKGRARVDRAVMAGLPQRDRARLRTTDPEFARRAHVKMFDGPTLDPADVEQ